MKKILFVIPVIYLIFGCSAKVTKNTENIPQKGQNTTTVNKESAIRTYIDGLIQSVKGNNAEAILNYQEALQMDPKAGIYYAIAKDFLRMNKIPSAIQSMNKAIELDSTNMEYYLFLGQLYTVARNTDLAIETFEKIIQVDSTNYQALFNLAGLYEPEKPIKALSFYNKVLQVIGPEWNVLVKIADLNERIGNVEKTISTVEELVNLNPSNLELKKLLIEAYIKNKNYDKAVSLIDETLELFPDDLSLVEYKANSLVRLEKWKEGGENYTLLIKSDKVTFENKLRIVSGFLEEAEKDSSCVEYAKNMLQIMDKDTSHWQIKILMAEINATENNDSLAVKYFKEAAQLGEWNEQLWIRLGGYLFDRKHYDQAIIEMENGLIHFPENFVINLVLAYSYSQKQDHQKAKGYFAKANDLKPNDLSVLSAYGYTLHQLGESDEALIYLNKAIAIDSQNAQVYGMMGMIYDKKQMWARCDSAYEKAIELDSADVLLLNNYAYSLSERGLQLDRCLSMAQTAVNKEPKNSSYLDTIGWIYFKLGNFELAKEYIEKSLEGDPKNAVVVEHLGDVYFKLGNREKAVEMWNKAVELDPSLNEVKTKIEKGEL
ncbi:MAG: tetratricopeptide repeat protein [bacterium]